MIGWPGLDYSGSGLLRLVLACPGPVGTYLAEMPLPQDSLNQMLEITEFLAWAYEIKKKLLFLSFQTFPPIPHLIVLILWVVIFQDSDVEGNDCLIPREIVIF